MILTEYNADSFIQNIILSLQISSLEIPALKQDPTPHTPQNWSQICKSKVQPHKRNFELNLKYFRWEITHFFLNKRKIRLGQDIWLYITRLIAHEIMTTFLLSIISCQNTFIIPLGMNPMTYFRKRIFPTAGTTAKSYRIKSYVIQ